MADMKNVASGAAGNAVQELSQNEMVQAHCVILRIRPDTVKTNGGNLLKTAHEAWIIGEETFNKLNNDPNHLILAVIEGIVRGVYQSAKWEKIKDGPNAGRYKFDAVDAGQNIQAQFIGKRINSVYRKPGERNPILLTW